MLKLLVLVATIMVATCFEFDNGFDYYEINQNQQDTVQSGLVDPPTTTTLPPTATLPPTPTLPTPPPTLPTPPPTQPATTPAPTLPTPTPTLPTPPPTTTLPPTPQPRRPTTNNTEFASIMSKLDDISGMLQKLNQSLHLLQGPNTSVFMQASCPTGTATIQTTSTTTTSTTTPIPTIFESDFDSEFDNFPELPAFELEEKKEEKENAEVNSGVTAQSIFDVVARWFESTNNQILIATLVPSLIVVVLLMIVFCGYCCGDRSTSTTGQNVDLEVRI
jgi:hypothetical protein